MVCITFTDEETLNKSAFTDYGFTKYNQKTFEKLIGASKIKLSELKQHLETMRNEMFGDVERKYWVAKLSKSNNGYA